MSLNKILTLTTRRSVQHLKQPSTRAFSVWGGVEQGPADPILGLTQDFNNDTDSRKVSVGAGAYRGEDGAPWVLPSVREAEQKILDAKMNHEYLPISGDVDFVKCSMEFLYGADSSALAEGRVAGSQALSGTGALCLAGHFLRKFKPGTPIYLPSPTWGNHHAIFRDAGIEGVSYRYLNSETPTLDFAGVCEDLSNAPKGAAVLFHACAHNPTGVDPNVEQWKELSEICKKNELIPLFDTAYQGFASGDADADAFSVRHFVEEGHSVISTQSFSKNFGLYGDRTGCLSFVTNSAEEKAAVESQIKLIVRPMYSNPPSGGARIVSTILNDPTLNAQWYAECKSMADRIGEARTALRGHLEANSTRDWSHVTSQIGMFAFTGLTADECAQMIEKHHVYLTKDGRVSMAGVTQNNAQYIAEAMADVTGGI